MLVNVKEKKLFQAEETAIADALRPCLASYREGWRPLRLERPAAGTLGDAQREATRSRSSGEDGGSSLGVSVH